MISRIIQTLLYNVGQLATGNKAMVRGNRDVLISSKNLIDVGKEIIVPYTAADQARQAYYTNYDAFDLRCAVLEKYLAQLLDVNNHPVSRVEFLDFFIVDQAYTFSYNYLEYHDDYEYEEDGLITLATKLALYLRANVVKRIPYNIWAPAQNLETNFGGFYSYKEGMDISTVLNNDVLDEIEDIYEPEDEDDDDE